jgi:phosphodiesterase/alkaline phosphatase D-like protein
VSAATLTGNLALFGSFNDSDGAALQWGSPRLWFRAWEGRGSALETYDERAFGPILFSQYTLSRGIMKMTAQMPPMGEADGKTVRLQVRQGEQWETVAEAAIHERAYTATFRVEDWNDSRDVPYRLVYRYQGPDGAISHHYEGTVRRDPVDKNEIVVGAFSCAKDTAFPHAQIAAGTRTHDPDVLAFTGDQYYEDSGGYGVQRNRDNLNRATLDVLRKWILHGWAFGELMRDRPTICLLDDHDVYHGNIWGEGGKQVDRWELHDNGGYFMPPEWVNAVQRMQTSHLPDPYDPTPVRNGITVYYTDMVYGRISFALLEDRKWKTGPDGLVPPNPGRPDHIEDPNFDPETVDVPAAKLLGDRQLTFLEDWTADWRGADMKAVISQTSFAQIPTHHGGNFKRLVADLDSNGWPQTPRDEALRRIRKGFAVHLGGDQHLPLLVQYGIDDWSDAPYNFCVPGIAVGYTRAFWPGEDGANPRTDVPYHTGEYVDGLGNKVTVRAIANPKKDYAADHPLQELANKSSGYGILRFDKASSKMTAECWPILSNPRKGESEQYAGWPQTFAMQDNYPREPVGHLPTLSVTGVTNPMVQVIDEERDEVVYTLRINGQTFRPKVFTNGPHTVRVGDDEAWKASRKGVQPSEGQQQRTLQVSL